MSQQDGFIKYVYSAPLSSTDAKLVEIIIDLDSDDSDITLSVALDADTKGWVKLKILDKYHDETTEIYLHAEQFNSIKEGLALLNSALKNKK
jgi:hypothetical protein